MPDLKAPDHGSLIRNSEQRILVILTQKFKLSSRNMIRDVYSGSRIPDLGFHSGFQCGGSGMFIPDPGSLIPDPDFYLSRISDPGSKNSNQRERWKKINCYTFLCSHKFHKIVNYFSFEVLKKKILANYQRIIELFTQKMVKKLLKIWSWDPRSGIRKKPIPDPGSRGQKGTGSRIRIRNTAGFRIQGSKKGTKQRFSLNNARSKVTYTHTGLNYVKKLGNKNLMFELL